ncbi:hypothetical protein K431DRAFT_216018 [Polychaeton citri CBS 116435]|uniref:Uncharacterized protein n=1 Tax=Polychaeton citri CBS 116435 TaxID=1314669 RepID=A0A9P4QHT3_9PEZI|nr:hypothetical protein K431DRAFT_216018 [Polychaeton citri CBS 116435]
MNYQQQLAQQQQQQQYGPQSTRRTLSSATSSTSSTSTSAGLSRAPTGSQVRRSTSSRSTASASPTSYVALMRKQKATVWCDRAQHEDPRILAAQRQAKMRAAMEVAGGAHHTGSNAGRTSTSSSGVVGGVRSKIRHHGAVKAQSYQAAGNLSGAGVPMRLSASEVDEGDSDEEPEARYTQKPHQRNGSGRSSLGSGQRMSTAYGQQQGMALGLSNNSSPTESNLGYLPEEQTPVPRGPEGDDYFAHSGGSGGSGGSIQREEGFGSVAQLPQRSAAREQRSTTTTEDLIRRGSVDERTMTMSGVRLFVANPDQD